MRIIKQIQVTETNKKNYFWSMKRHNSSLKLSFISVLFLALFCLPVVGQENGNKKDWTLYPEKPKNPSVEREKPKPNQIKKGDGTITIIEDARIDQLLEKEISINEKKGTIPGFRIQLYYGSGPESRKKATQVQADFLRLYPEMPSYLIFQSPNFKIRIGDFRSKLEAEKFLKEIKAHFENAFIVKDEIKLPPLD